MGKRQRRLVPIMIGGAAADIGWDLVQWCRANVPERVCSMISNVDRLALSRAIAPPAAVICVMWLASGGHSSLIFARGALR